MVPLAEGVVRAPRVCAMLEMKGVPRVHAPRGRGVRLFKVRCSRGSKSNGEV